MTGKYPQFIATIGARKRYKPPVAPSFSPKGTREKPPSFLTLNLFL